MAIKTETETPHLELAATNSSHKRLFLCLCLNQDFKLFSVQLSFYRTLIRPAASASDITRIQCFITLTTTIIVIIINDVSSYEMGVSWRIGAISTNTVQYKSGKYAFPDIIRLTARIEHDLHNETQSPNHKAMLLLKQK